MVKEHSIKISPKGYNKIENLLTFFKKRYGHRNFTKKGVLENALRVYEKHILDSLTEK